MVTMWIVDPMIARSGVRLPAGPLSGNNPGQGVLLLHTPQPIGVMPPVWGLY